MTLANNIIAFCAAAGIVGAIVYALLSSRFDDRYQRLSNCVMNHTALEKTMLRLETKLDDLIKSIMQGQIGK
jgi:hypothetical protein